MNKKTKIPRQTSFLEQILILIRLLSSSAKSAKSSFLVLLVREVSYRCLSTSMTSHSETALRAAVLLQQLGVLFAFIDGGAVWLYPAIISSRIIAHRSVRECKGGVEVKFK